MQSNTAVSRRQEEEKEEVDGTQSRAGSRQDHMGGLRAVPCAGGCLHRGDREKRAVAGQSDRYQTEL